MLIPITQQDNQNIKEKRTTSVLKAASRILIKSQSGTLARALLAADFSILCGTQLELRSTDSSQ
jgi:hypothetical protein